MRDEAHLSPDFDTWKDALSRDRNPLETREVRPIEQVLQKMVSISALMEDVEVSDSATSRECRRRIRFEDLDRWIEGTP